MASLPLVKSRRSSRGRSFKLFSAMAQCSQTRLGKSTANLKQCFLQIAAEGESEIRIPKADGARGRKGRTSERERMAGFRPRRGGCVFRRHPVNWDPNQHGSGVFAIQWKAPGSGSVRSASNACYLPRRHGTGHLTATLLLPWGPLPMGAVR